MSNLEPVLGGDDTIRRNFSKIEDVYTRLAAAETGLAAAEISLAAVVAALGGLRIVRGVVGLTAGGATITEGTGFTVLRDAIGTVTITFTTAFSDRPAVNVTPIGGARSGTEAAGSPASASAFQASILTTTTGANVDASFHFIAIGPT